eukprot:scaffold42641_cov205-Skeletonema_dohrnii-CCMP3373.AAC.1
MRNCRIEKIPTPCRRSGRRMGSTNIELSVFLQCVPKYILIPDALVRYSNGTHAEKSVRREKEKRQGYLHAAKRMWIKKLQLWSA